MRRAVSFGFHSPVSKSWGPYLYVEFGRFMLHTWARRFGLPWHRGCGARFCVRLGRRYFSRGCGVS